MDCPWANLIVVFVVVASQASTVDGVTVAAEE
jgi:hypothetical protein